MEDKTIQSLEIKRSRLRRIRPLTKEEIKVKAEIDIFKYVIKKIETRMKTLEDADLKLIGDNYHPGYYELMELIKLFEAKE